MESVAEMESLHQKCAQGHIGSQTEKSTVPLLVGDVHVPQQQQRYHQRGRQTVMQQAGNGGQIEDRRSLVNKTGVDSSGNAAKQTQQPNTVQSAVVLPSKKHCQRKDQTGHTAKTVRDDTIPPNCVVAKHLGQPVDHDCQKQQRSQAFQENGFGVFCDGVFFAQQ